MYGILKIITDDIMKLVTNINVVDQKTKDALDDPVSN
jgi:hypothetical protein